MAELIQAGLGELADMNRMAGDMFAPPLGTIAVRLCVDGKMHAPDTTYQARGTVVLSCKKCSQHLYFYGTFYGFGTARQFIIEEGIFA